MEKTTTVNNELVVSTCSDNSSECQMSSTGIATVVKTVVLSSSSSLCALSNDYPESPPFSPSEITPSSFPVHQSNAITDSKPQDISQKPTRMNTTDNVQPSSNNITTSTSDISTLHSTGNNYPVSTQLTSLTTLQHSQVDSQSSSKSATQFSVNTCTFEMHHGGSVTGDHIKPIELYQENESLTAKEQKFNERLFDVVRDSEKLEGNIDSNFDNEADRNDIPLTEIETSHVMLTENEIINSCCHGSNVIRGDSCEEQNNEMKNDKIFNSITDDQVPTEDSTVVDQVTTEDSMTVDQVPTEDSTVEDQVLTEDSMTVDQVPTEDSTVKDQVPTEDSTVEDQVPTEDSTVEDQVLTEDSTVEDQVPTEDSTVEDQVLTEDSMTVDQVPTEDSTVKDQVPTEDSTVEDQVPTEDSTVEDQVPTEDSMTVDQVPTEDSTVEDQVLTEDSTVEDQVPTEDSTVEDQVLTEDSMTVEDQVPTEDSTVEDQVPTEDSMTVEDQVPTEDSMTVEKIKYLLKTIKYLLKIVQ